jgi:predicted flap endonuclease-1-like 5' DNA nuclease
MTIDLEGNLKQQGLYRSDQLLESARLPAGRQALAARAGVDSRAILELANRADLARVRGIAGVFSDLLEHAGVDTVRELANRNARNLYAKLAEVNGQQRIAGRMPSQRMVEDWVAQAKELPRLLEY